MTETKGRGGTGSNQNESSSSLIVAIDNDVKILQKSKSRTFLDQPKKVLLERPHKLLLSRVILATLVVELPLVVQTVNSIL